MDRPSGIPRPSKLPVPRAAVRPSPSRENLQQPARLGSVINPRLRSTPSREHLSSFASNKQTSHSLAFRKPETSTGTGNRTSSAGTIIHTPTKSQVRRQPSHDVLFRKPSRNFSGGGVAQDDGSPISEEVEDPPVIRPDISRKPRPSLSERTMETLQSIPSSPAVRKRTSSFFNHEAPMRPPSSGFQSSRPGSSQHSDGSMRPPSRSVSSRPASRGNTTNSQGQADPFDFHASTNTFRAPQSTVTSHTPLKRPSGVKALNTPSKISHNMPPTPDSSTSTSPNNGHSVLQRSPSPTRPAAKASGLKSASHTLVSRPLKQRSSIKNLSRKPSMPSLDNSGEKDRVGNGQKKKTSAFSNSFSGGSSINSRKHSSNESSSMSNDREDATPRKSSAALRDQIAKAKAAKRAATAKQISDLGTSNDEMPVIPNETFDFGLTDDPFNQKNGPNSAKGLLRKRVDAARSDGRLNIAAMSLKAIPDEVLNMYNLDAIENGSWAECVDLRRFIAADNELELISDDVFPDIDPRESADDEDAKGNQFGGLETLDLHSNALKALPLGLRRLELLTTLNLANNKLENDCIEVISQISSLRYLNIAGNELTGSLEGSISSLRGLETLEVQRNSLTALPEGLADLVHLRVLNVSENSFMSLPFISLRNSPLLELLAAKNKLSGALIPPDVEELPHIQLLDVTANSLTSIAASGRLSLPSLHQLSCTSNRLERLPDMSSWVSLLTIAAEDNNLAAIPDGFVTLQKLKNVNFNGNNIKIINDEVGAMDSLDIFRISGNPLRDKKFASMTTEELKRALRARMAPPEHEVKSDADDEAAFYSAPATPTSPNSAVWPVKAGGILDRSHTQSHSLNPVAAAEVADANHIKTLELHHNKFSDISMSIAFFAMTLTTLSLAHNELNNDTFMKDDLELPALKELNLSSNTITTLQPLFQHLLAPKLEKLDISFNRLTSLPPVKKHFRNLVTLFASNNSIKELTPESVKGLRTLDASSNDINSLNARLGLLGGPGGLERLDVSGNRFRVPKYTILEKGTEATLAWLRDRIPAGETSPIHSE